MKESVATAKQKESTCCKRIPVNGKYIFIIFNIIVLTSCRSENKNPNLISNPQKDEPVLEIFDIRFYETCHQTQNGILDKDSTVKFIHGNGGFSFYPSDSKKLTRVGCTCANDSLKYCICMLGDISNSAIIGELTKKLSLGFKVDTTGGYEGSILRYKWESSNYKVVYHLLMADESKKRSQSFPDRIEIWIK